MGAAVLLLAVMSTSHAELISGPTTYRGAAIDAVVVDGDTGSPLPGVIVVVYWETEGAHALPQGVMAVMETVSNDAGAFHFPAWGPEVRAPETRLPSDAPALLLFKPWYRYRRVFDQGPDVGTGDSVRESTWAGSTIRLAPFKDTPAEYAEELTSVDGTAIGFAFRHHDCSWKHIRRLLAALIRQGPLFHDAHVKNYLLTLKHREEMASAKTCGALAPVIEPYLR